MSFSQALAKIKENEEIRAKSTPIAMVAPELKQNADDTEITKTCAVLGCDESKNFNSDSFFRFPEDPSFRQIWTDLTGRNNWTPTDYSYICVQHFSVDCFECDESDAVVLNSKAVPSLKLPKHVLEVEYIDEETFDNEYEDDCDDADDQDYEMENEEENMEYEEEHLEEEHLSEEYNNVHQQQPNKVHNEQQQLYKQNQPQQQQIVQQKLQQIAHQQQQIAQQQQQIVQQQQIAQQQITQQQHIAQHQQQQQQQQRITQQQQQQRIAQQQQLQQTVQKQQQIAQQQQLQQTVQQQQQHKQIQLRQQHKQIQLKLPHQSENQQHKQNHQQINISNKGQQVVSNVKYLTNGTPNHTSEKPSTSQVIDKKVEQSNKIKEQENLELLKLFTEVQVMQRQAVSLKLKLRNGMRTHKRQKRCLARLKEEIDIKKNILLQRRRKKSRILLSLQDKIREDTNGLVLAMPARHTDDLKNFALSIYKYSPQAYIYIRNTLRTLLPSTDVLDSWVLSGYEPANVLTNSNMVRVVSELTDTELSCKVSLR